MAERNLEKSIDSHDAPRQMSRMNHGGKRKNSGRKKKAPSVALCLRLRPELFRAWKNRKRTEKTSGPKLLKALLEK